jgi:hypothetical protein
MDQSQYLVILGMLSLILANTIDEEFVITKSILNLSALLFCIAALFY